MIWSIIGHYVVYVVVVLVVIQVLQFILAFMGMDPGGATILTWFLGIIAGVSLLPLFPYHDPEKITPKELLKIQDHVKIESVISFSREEDGEYSPDLKKFKVGETIYVKLDTTAKYTLFNGRKEVDVVSSLAFPNDEDIELKQLDGTLIEPKTKGNNIIFSSEFPLKKWKKTKNEIKIKMTSYAEGEIDIKVFYGKTASKYANKAYTVEFVTN